MTEFMTSMFSGLEKHWMPIASGVAGILLALVVVVLWLRRRSRRQSSAHILALEESHRREVAQGQAIYKLKQERETLRQNERVLQKNEVRTRAILETAADGIIIWDEQGIIESFNQTAELIFSHRAEEVVGQHVAQILLSWDNEAADQDDRAPAGVGAEQTGQRADGSVFPIELTVSTVALDGQKRFTGLVRDITQRKQVEEELRESAMQYRGAVEQLSEAVILMDLQGTVTTWNAGACRLFGRQSEAAEGKPIAQLLEQEGKSVLDREALSTAVAKGHFVIECTLQTQAGDPVDVHLSLSPWRNPHGHPIGVIAVGWDIGPQRLAEEALKQTQEKLSRSEKKKQQVEAECRRLELAVETSADAVMVTDRQCKIQQVNRTFEAMTGFTATEVVGQTPGLLKSDEHPKEFYDEMWKTILQGKPWQDRVVNRHKSGKTVAVMLTITPILGDDGQIEGFVGVARDVSAVELAEEEMSASQTEIEKVSRQLERSSVQAKQLAHQVTAANQTTSRYMAGMTQALGSPLHGVVGFAELLEGTELNDEQREFVESIRSCTEEVLSNIHGLRDYSESQTGKLTLEEVEFDVAKLTGQACEIVKPLLTGRPVTMVRQMDQATPKCAKGDPGRLKQILLNLLTNAAKFTQEGQIEVRIAPVSETPAQVVLQFAVKDTGVGIAKDRHQRIFDPFTSVEVTDTQDQGSRGLGLPIAKRLVEQMGGEIRMESQPGKGSTFVFTVPLGRVEDPGAQSSSASEAPAGDQPARKVTRKGVCVLVADDNRLHLMVVGKLLRQVGCQVQVAHDGREALEKVKENEYEMVFLAMEMPELTGVEAAQSIRKAGKRDVPLVALVGQGQDDEARRCLEAGMNDCIAKPVGRKALLEQMAKWVADWYVEDPVEPTVPDDVPLQNTSGQDCPGDLVEQLPGMLDQITAALEARDIEKLQFLAFHLRQEALKAQHLELMEKVRALTDGLEPFRNGQAEPIAGALEGLKDLLGRLT